MDRDGSGFITLAEFILADQEMNDYPMTQEKAANEIAKVDTNKDGRISLEELKIYFNSGRCKARPYTIEERVKIH